MSRVFASMVRELGNATGSTWSKVSHEDYELWKKDYTWEALHGMRYGQSFCNRFNITDNHLFYAPGDVAWCDKYIQATYIEKS